MSAATRTFEVRHVQLARAVLAALAAVMITFSPDHSAAVGLAVFSGWAIATGLVLLLGAWLVSPTGSRPSFITLGALTLIAGLVAGAPALRTTTLFFILLIVWSLVTGVAELAFGLVARRTGSVEAKDAVLIGAVTIALGIGLLLVNPGYSLDYFIEKAGWFTLTGIVIGVGLYGAYAAIVAVFLGIAGFSPRRAVPVSIQAPGASHEGETA